MSIKTKRKPSLSDLDFTPLFPLVRDIETWSKQVEALAKSRTKSHHAVLSLESDKHALKHLVKALCTKISAQMPDHWPAFDLEVDFDDAEPRLFSPLNPDLFPQTTTSQGLAYMLGALSQAPALAKSCAHPKMAKRLADMHVSEKFNKPVQVTISGEVDIPFKSHLSVNDAKAQGLIHFVLQGFRQVNPLRKSKDMNKAYVAGQKFANKVFDQYDRISWSLDKHFVLLMRQTRLLPKPILKELEDMCGHTDIDLAYSRLYRLLKNTNTTKEKSLFSAYGPRDMQFAQKSQAFKAHDPWHAKTLALTDALPTSGVAFERIVSSMDKWTVYELTPTVPVSLNIA
jgi:hypothetical protein